MGPFLNHTTPQPALPLALARNATRVQFAILGTLAGTWGAHIPSVKRQYGLDEASLSWVLLAAGCGAVASLFFAGKLVARLGARNTAAWGGLLMGLVLAVVLVLPGLPFLLAMMVVFGASMSLFDVSINAEGTELESLYGRPVMGNLHAMFSVGGMLGAGLTSALLRHGVPAVTQVAGIALACAAVSVATSRGMLNTHPSHDASHASFAWPRGLLLLMGLLIFAGMLAEGVMYDWSVLYLKQEVGMPQAQAAIGYAVFSAAMAGTRFGGDALRQRFSERALLFWGAALSACAMAVVLVAGSVSLVAVASVATVAFVGFAMVGSGLALVVPILFSAATRVPGVSPAAAIAAVSSIGYAGFMVGPPLIGGIAQHSSLTLALSVVVLAAGMLALGSRLVPAKASR